jgi:peroxiredoxin
MSLVKFHGRAQAVTILLVIAVTAIAGLLLLMTQLAGSKPSTLANNQLPSPVEAATSINKPDQPNLDDAVATVNNQIITQQAWQQATRLDAVMSQLAAQPIPTAEETLDRLINEIIVLEAAPALNQAVEAAEVEVRIQALETNWQVSDEKVVSTLAQAGLRRSDLEARVHRLIQVEAALHQLDSQEDDLTTWLTEARASAEIGLYRSLVSDQATSVSQSVEEPKSEASPLPPGAPALSPVFAPPPEMAISPYPQNAAPDFTLAQVNGNPSSQAQEITLSSLRGKPTLINFWASWCPPCRRELPALQAAYAKYKDKIGFIAVNVKEDPAVVSALAEELGLNFPIALDPDGQISNVAYEVRGLPTTVFVDANGVVSARHVGPLDEEMIETYLAPLLEIESKAKAEAENSRETESIESSQSSNPPAFQSSPAPDFTLTAANGNAVSLQDYRDKSNVVLIFYRGHT